MNTCDRLTALSPWAMEDGLYWPLREICDALRVPSSSYRRRQAYRLAGAPRYILLGNRWQDRQKLRLVDRAGAERLIIRYGGRTSRLELLAALDGTAAQARAAPRWQ